MKYNCKIKKQGSLYIAEFPDMPNVQTCGKTKKEALEMAKDALEGCLAVSLDENLEIPTPSYSQGEPIEVSAKVAFAIELRIARGTQSQSAVAKKAGMTYQQYQRLENPKKTNPTLETLEKLQNVFQHPFLAL